ncbi:MAG: hypothetical protein WC790_00470 [Candidatus Paceibacterota bacterium]|jgi:hypothetical protein
MDELIDLHNVIDLREVFTREQRANKLLEPLDLGEVADIVNALDGIPCDIVCANCGFPEFRIVQKTPENRLNGTGVIYCWVCKTIVGTINLRAGQEDTLK